MRIVLTIPMLVFLSLLACDEPAQLPTCEDFRAQLDDSCYWGCMEVREACSQECIGGGACSPVCAGVNCHALCDAALFNAQLAEEYGYCEA